MSVDDEREGTHHSEMKPDKIAIQRPAVSIQAAKEAIVSIWMIQPRRERLERLWQRNGDSITRNSEPKIQGTHLTTIVGSKDIYDLREKVSCVDGWTAGCWMNWGHVCHRIKHKDWSSCLRVAASNTSDVLGRCCIKYKQRVGDVSGRWKRVFGNLNKGSGQKWEWHKDKKKRKTTYKGFDV